MPFTGQGVEIYLPEMESLPWGLFTDVVPEIPVTDLYERRDRTAAGGKFMAPGALSPIVQDFDCDTDDDKTGNITLSEEETAAALIMNLWECSELSGDLRPGRDLMKQTFEATLSEALAFIATSPAISASHLNLTTNSTALAAPTDPTDAIGVIEDGLRERISNRRGHIFVPPRHLAYVMGDGSVFLRGDQLVSAAGHRVISDAGHVGDDTFFGTGSMGYSVREQDVTGDDGELDRTRNIRSWLTEAYGVIFFNPAWSVRATIAP